MQARRHGERRIEGTRRSDAFPPRPTRSPAPSRQKEPRSECAPALILRRELAELMARRLPLPGAVALWVKESCPEGAARPRPASDRRSRSPSRSRSFTETLPLEQGEAPSSRAVCGPGTPFPPARGRGLTCAAEGGDGVRGHLCLRLLDARALERLTPSTQSFAQSSSEPIASAEVRPIDPGSPTAARRRPRGTELPARTIQSRGAGNRKCRACGKGESRTRAPGGSRRDPERGNRRGRGRAAAAPRLVGPPQAPST